MDADTHEPRDRSPATERALALLMMVDDHDATDAPIIAELAAQLSRQLLQGHVGTDSERALLAFALQRAGVAPLPA